MSNRPKSGAKLLLLAGSLASSFLAATVFAQAAPGKGAVTSASVSSPTPSSPHRHRSPYRSAAVSIRAKDFYQLTWGVDLLSAKLVESGEMVRFSYRVLDAEKAKALNDKKNSPFLIDETAHVKLVVPTLEKVGQLRQSSTPEGGKVYWMAFSNKGRYVKPGHRVSVVIGKFQADGLVVQ